MWHVPIAFITGQTGKNVKALLNHAQMLFKQSLDRVSTSELNRLIRAAMKKTPPPMYGSFRPKIYYATQVGIQPPTLVLMCNEPRAFQPAYRRYLLGILRDYLKFGEVPIKLYLKKRVPSDKRDEVEPEVGDEVVASHEELMAAGADAGDESEAGSSIFDSGDVLAVDGGSDSDNVLDEGEN
jgi:GTP-binding protein